MSAVVLAKVRARRRRGEDGAVMFIVAMILAVLASVGIYALAAASLEIKSSGNERQNTQTHYLAEYGVLGASYVMTATRAQFYLGLMLSNPDYPCVSLPGVAQTADIMQRACRRMGLAEISAGWQSPATVLYSGSAPYSASPGSLGPTPMTADFFVELTAPTVASAPPNYALDLHFCFIQMTATAVGLTQPLYPWMQSADQTGTFAGEGMEMQRARFVAGPVQCPR